MTAEGKRSVTIECPECAHSWRVGDETTYSGVYLACGWRP